MKIGTMMVAAGALALGLATWTPSKAQGPLYDRVNVNLPYSVTIGDRTLQPGDYIIQQLRDQGGGSRVLLIYSDSGMKFETSAMTIPALENRTPEDTKVVLHHFGSDYYFDKIWIQGKNYGYEFPLPDAVKSRERERMQQISVAANYSTAQQTDTTSTATTTTATQTPAPVPQPEPVPTPVTREETTTAQAAPPQAPPPVVEQPAPQPTIGDADRSMPDTAAGWVMMLLSGGALSGAGLALRRRR